MARTDRVHHLRDEEVTATICSAVPSEGDWDWSFSGSVLYVVTLCSTIGSVVVTTQWRW